MAVNPIEAGPILARLRTLPGQAGAALRRAMEAEATALRDAARDRLRGMVKTDGGRLADSLRVEIEDQADGNYAAIVRSELAYAAFIENGFHGLETVAAHLRRITEAFGRPIVPVEELVRQHTRRVDAPAHPFLEEALDERAQAIRDSLADAVKASLTGGGGL